MQRPSEAVRGADGHLTPAEGTQLIGLGWWLAGRRLRARVERACPQVSYSETARFHSSKEHPVPWTILDRKRALGNQLPLFVL